MRFDGGYQDPTGWYHFGQRYYSPKLGRWSQPDPMAGDISAPKNTDRYLFAGDDPVNNGDPTGEMPVSGGLTIGGAALAFGAFVLSAGAGATAGVMALALGAEGVFGATGILGVGMGMGTVGAVE